MSINFEKALGSAERALIFRSQRAEILSNNIANADTPNFKARDLDFSTVLLQSQTKETPATPISLKTTNVKHITGKESVNDIYGGALLYSTPAQPAIDQNTVDQQVEIAKYTENGIRYLFVIGPNLDEVMLTTYGVLLFLKVLLFAGMIVLATLNRFHLSPVLERSVRNGEYSAAVNALRRSMTLEFSMAVVIICLVAWLGTLSPEMEMSAE
ncbi:flagellar basal body rod protein FlgB [Pseudomonas mohnii]